VSAATQRDAPASAASQRVVITIDGIDGSGKSTFARRLAAALAVHDVRAAPISVDDFRRPVDWAATASEADVYYDSYYDLAAADALLAAFLAGARAADVPRFDPVTERPLPPRRVELLGAVALLEGVFPLRAPKASSGLVIYLDTSEALARQRIIARDLKKGRTRDEIERRIDRRYLPGQRRYHTAYDPRGRADVIIDNEHPATARCLRRDLARLPPELRAAVDRALPR
jgi:uridine kinase